MKTLADYLIEIRDELSNKKNWEEHWESNRVTGYASGSLMNCLSAIYSAGGKKEYPAAYACIAKAIIELFEDKIKAAFSYGNTWSWTSFTDWKYSPSKDDMMTLRLFQEYKNHDDLIVVLDLAIRYAKVWIFS